MKPIGISFVLGGITGLISACGPDTQEIRFVDVTDSHLSADLPLECMDVAAGDVDGDGDLDLAIIVEGGGSHALALNDGSGSFTLASPGFPSSEADGEDAEFADFDRDGDLDIVIVSENRLVNEMYLNDGAGRFTNVSDRLPLQGWSNALAVMDLNGDGALDLLIGNYGTEGLMINDGNGYFLDGTDRYWPDTPDDRTQDIELVDVDGDGDLDVAVANEGQNRLYLNEGGRLVDATEGRLPIREDESREYKAADVDSDGDMDLILVNIKLEFIDEDWSRRDYVLMNDGSGVFTIEWLPDWDRDHMSVAAMDLDVDGDPDIIIPGAPLLPDNSDYRVLMNNGSGSFTGAEPGTFLPLSVNDNGWGFDIQIGDFNQDGRDDLFLCNRSVPRTDPVEGGRHNLLFQSE